MSTRKLFEWRHVLPPLAVALAVSGCAQDELILPGERFDIRDLENAQTDADSIAAELAVGTIEGETPPQPPRVIPIAGYSVQGEPKGLSLPAQRANSEWTHVLGGPTHQIVHPALGGSLTRVWSTSIGEGSTKRRRITATPVVASGRIFTLDSVGDVRAHSTQGSLLWSRSLIPASERAGEASGGGVSAAGNRLFVTTGYGAVHALDLTSGTVLWTQQLGAVPAASPTIADGMVYLTTRDGRAWALDSASGRVRWQLSASETPSVVIDGAAPAVAGRSAIFPFGSGELIAVLKRGGVRLWSTALAGERAGRAYTKVSDISADPVVVGNTVYVGSPSGRLVALDATSGERRWTALEGANSGVWVEGNSLFLVSDENKLLRMNTSDGSVVWSATLPLYTEEKVRKRKSVFAHYGPVLAGGRLIVVSNDGIMRQVNPTSGQLLSSTQLPGDAAADPIVAGRTLYVVTADGMLHAFR